MLIFTLLTPCHEGGRWCWGGVTRGCKHRVCRFCRLSDMSRPLTVAEFSNLAEGGVGLLRWPSADCKVRVSFATSSFPPTVKGDYETEPRVQHGALDLSRESRGPRAPSTAHPCPTIPLRGSWPQGPVQVDRSSHHFMIYCSQAREFNFQSIRHVYYAPDGPGWCSATELHVRTGQNPIRQPLSSSLNFKANCSKGKIEGETATPIHSLSPCGCTCSTTHSFCPPP